MSDSPDSKKEEVSEDDFFEALAPAWLRERTGQVPETPPKKLDEESSYEDLPELLKVHPPINFPKLGAPEDRRETPLISTDQQLKTKHAILQNKFVNKIKNVPVSAPRVRTEAEKGNKERIARTLGSKSGTLGLAISGPTVQGWALTNNSKFQGQKPTSTINEAESGPIATLQHENFHQMLMRVERTHGKDARRNLADNLLEAIPSQYRSEVQSHLSNRRPDIGYKHPLASEEALAHLISYVNNKADRRRYHNNKGYSDGQAKDASTKMKRAYEHLRSIGEVADENWLTSDRPWRVDRFAKSETPVDKLADPHFSDTEHSMALRQLGHDADADAALKAAKFLIGPEAVPDLDRFRLALIIHDHDIYKSALIAYGLADSEENLKALKACLELGDFNKSEAAPINIQSVQAGHPDATETAAEVMRAIESGHIHNLVLKGKHSKGALAARDPQTGHVWLLKIGSGALSPAKGIRDSNTSQSRREAGFWHAAKAMGCSDEIPRADLLIIDGEEWAAINLLKDFKNLDKVNRKEPGRAIKALEPYRHDTLLFRWAFLDGLLGQADRHGQNVLIGPKDQIALIDHGSAFAGVHFDPAHDAKSFVPYYLRVWCKKGKYTALPPDQRLEQLPHLNHEEDEILGSWIAGINIDVVAQILTEYLIDPLPVVSRFKTILSMDGPWHLRINRLWAGLEPWIQKEKAPPVGPENSPL